MMRGLPMANFEPQSPLKSPAGRSSAPGDKTCARGLALGLLRRSCFQECAGFLWKCFTTVACTLPLEDFTVISTRSSRSSIATTQLGSF